MAVDSSWNRSLITVAALVAIYRTNELLLLLASRGASSPLKAGAPSDVEMLNGRLRLKSEPLRVVRICEVMRRNGLADITETLESRPFVEEDDTVVNPLRVKGVGELGRVGIPAAIANAVFDATGRRIREIPITPEKLL